MKKLVLLILVCISFANKDFAQCVYNGTPLTQVGSPYTFCIDNGTSYTTPTVNAGQYILVNVIKGYAYTFSIGNVFASYNENLTIVDASTNSAVVPATFASGASGATISNWVSSISGQIKILLSKGSCLNDNTTGGVITLTQNSIGDTQDSQTASGTDQWIGHVYNWTGSTPPGGTSPSSPTATTPFLSANYAGNYAVGSETIAETFGGSSNCFPVYSNGAVRANIYTETFAVRYRMHSTKTGCYMASFSGDDGIRIYVDGVKVFDAWQEQGATAYGNVLLYLNGNSDLVFDYYENGGANTVNFSLAPFDTNSNTITATATSVYSATAPGILTGSNYTYSGAIANPTISYQWQSSSDGINYTNIVGATSKDYTPLAITTTTTVTTYYRRVVSASASNASACSFYSNVVAITTLAYTACSYSSSYTQVGTANIFCIDSSNTLYSPTVNAGQYVVVNVVKGFTYTFSIGNVFATDNETLTILDASTNGNVTPTTFANGVSGTSINWTATLSGQIKILLSKGGCINDNSTGGSITMVLNSIGNTQDSQTAFGTDQWVGHVYNWTGTAPPGGAPSSAAPSTLTPYLSSNYVGYYNVGSETIAEAFGGSYNCFPVYSNTAVNTNIYTETFAVRYRMHSTKTGCYVATFSGDDGIRLYVDGVKVFDAWQEQSATAYGNVLLYLNGNSDIVFDYYENGGANTVNFSLAPFDAGTNTIIAPTPAYVCSGATPNLIVGSSYTYTGAVVNPTINFQWQSSTDGITFTNISGATSKDYTPTAITTTTTNVVRYYRRMLNAAAGNASSCSYYSNAINITTSPSGIPATPTAISGTTPQCASSTGNVYSISAVNNAVTYNWTVPSGWTITAGQGTTSITVTSGTTGQNGTIGVSATNGCGTSAIKTLAVTVVQAPVGGGVYSGTTPICLNSSTGNMTLGGGYIGTVVRWEKSLNNGAWVNIANTATTYSESPSVSGTWQYRALVGNGNCTPVYSTSFSVVVNSALTITLGSNPVVCKNTTATTLPYTATTGSPAGWTLTFDSVALSAGFSNQNGSLNTAPSSIPINVPYNVNAGVYNASLVVITYYPSCSSTSYPVTVTVSPASVAGTASANQTICSGSQPAALTLTGNTGTVQWQSSTNNTTFVAIVGATGTTLTATQMGSLSATTYYRAVVTSGTCSSVNSNTITITVNPSAVAGTISANQSICSGSQPASITLTGSVGAIQWQSSSDNVTFTNITGATTATLSSATIGVLTATKYFRAVVTNGSCPSATSAVVTISINATSVGGTVSSSQTVCMGTQPASLTLTGNVGNIVKWQKANDATFATPIDIPTTSATLTGANIGSIAITTFVRAVVQSGSCSTAYSNYVTIGLGGNSVWNGSTWDVMPNGTTNLIINGNYNSTSNVPGCTCTINSGAVVINSNNNMLLTGALAVNGGSLTFENNANLLQVNAVANSGTITLNRNSSALKRLDYTMWSSPVANQNLLSFSPSTLTNRFYNYNTSTNLYNAIADPSSTNFAQGSGYLIRLPNNHPTTPTIWNGVFSGVPNNGTYTVPLTNQGAGLRFNMIGNPYPSPISMTNFVADNSANITGTLYFWRKTNNMSTTTDYCTWAGGTFVSDGEDQVFNPNGIIQTGQGFLVEASATGTAISFNNSQRVINNANQFFKLNGNQSQQNIDYNRIWLNMTSPASEFAQMAVGYITGATQDVDLFDGKNLATAATITLNSILDNTDYAIQGRALPFDPADDVPLSYKVTAAGSYTIAIDHVDGLFSGNAQDIYLKDNLTNTYTNLNLGNYTFASDAGSFANRFEIVYQTPLSTSVPAFTENSVIVYKNNGTFYINSGALNMDNIKIYDISGRLIKEKTNINASTIAIDGSSFANQVLLFQITSDKQEQVTKKVVN